LPERVVTNEDLAQLVETSDEWIRERTGIRERRVVEPDQAASDIAVPAAREALERAGIAPGEVDLVIVATATPDMFFPATASLVGEELGAFDAAAYDLSAGCTGFVYGLAQAYGSIAAGLALRVLVVGTETLSKVVNWQDRTTCILFGDGAAAALVEPVVDGGFVGFELGSDGSRAPDLCLPAGGSRAPASAQTIEQELHFLRMNGPEVFRLATRVMVSSGEKLLDECGLGVEDVDLYAPHQANRRIIDHAVRALRLPSEKVLVNVDRFGNTSSASIPLCLHEALVLGRLEAGMTVLMTAVGAGLTWGSSLVVWGNGR
jgi:3-oxoacyl-[acyl-carrier-protein] synthase-3